MSDEVELIGMGPDIIKEFAGEARGDRGRIEDLYVKALRKLIAEGIDHHLAYTLEWVEYAGVRILRVEVPRGADRPYALFTNGDVFVRTGANNRRIRHADIPAVFPGSGTSRWP